MLNTVNFPGLGLSFELNRVAFTLFVHDVYWYGVIIATGFALAVIYCYYNAYRFGVDNELIFDMLILPQTPLPSRLPHNMEQSSLCYAVGPCWSSSLNIAACTCPSLTP